MMDPREIVNRAGRITLEHISGLGPPVDIYGIKIVGTDRDIYRNITNFEFENGWVISIQIDAYYRKGGPDAVIRALVREIEKRLRFLDPMDLQAFRAPEVLVDEDPDELDPFPVFVCDCCRNDYRY